AHTIVSSQFVADDLRRAGIDRVTRIPLGVDLVHYHPGRREKREEVRERYGLPDTPVAGFVGRFSAEKELDVLLDAWPAADKANRGSPAGRARGSSRAAAHPSPRPPSRCSGPTSASWARAAARTRRRTTRGSRSSTGFSRSTRRWCGTTRESRAPRHDPR